MDIERERVGEIQGRVRERDRNGEESCKNRDISFGVCFLSICFLFDVQCSTLLRVVCNSEAISPAYQTIKVFNTNPSCVSHMCVSVHIVLCIHFH